MNSESKKRSSEYFPDEKNQDFWTRQAMIKHGGSFVRSLAICMEHADAVNYAKLSAMFPELLEEYRAFGELLEAKGS